MVRSEARTTKESADTYLSFDTMAFFDLAVGSRGGREAVTKRGAHHPVLAPATRRPSVLEE